MDFSKFSSDLHASERRVRPAQESSELKTEDTGVCRLNIIQFSLLSSGLLGLLWVILCRTWSLPSRACKTWGLQSYEDWTCQPWAGNLAWSQAGFSWKFVENDTCLQSISFSEEFSVMFHWGFSDGHWCGLAPHFVAEIPLAVSLALAWLLILCLCRRQHLAVLTVGFFFFFFFFFKPFLTSLHTNGEALIMCCSPSPLPISPATQLYKYKKE